MTIASYITLLRIFLIIPVIFFSSFQDSFFNYLALVLFLLAILTDYFDGYVARKTKTVTELGALLDLLADKLLVSIILIWLLFINNGLVLIIPILIIVSRELIISSLRQYAIESKKRIEVTMLGKGKTTVQFLSISLIIISPEFGNYFYITSILFIWVSALISVISLYNYANSTIKNFKL